MPGSSDLHRSELLPVIDVGHVGIQSFVVVWAFEEVCPSFPVFKEVGLFVSNVSKFRSVGCLIFCTQLVGFLTFNLIKWKDIIGGDFFLEMLVDTTFFIHNSINYIETRSSSI